MKFLKALFGKKPTVRAETDHPVALEALSVKYPTSLKPTSLAEHLGGIIAANKPSSGTALRQKSEGKTKRGAYAPKPGGAWNPLRQYPRNQPCFCGSLVKAKKCCLPYLAQAVSREVHDYVKNNWYLILDGRLKLPKASGGSR
jgi:hypothetical protein